MRQLAAFCGDHSLALQLQGQTWLSVAALLGQKPAQPAGRNAVKGMAHLLHRELLQAGQGAGEQADEEGGGRAHDVDHGRWQHGDVGVLPGEGVQEGHRGVAALGERAGR